MSGEPHDLDGDEPPRTPPPEEHLEDTEDLGPVDAGALVGAHPPVEEPPPPAEEPRPIPPPPDDSTVKIDLGLTPPPPVLPPPPKPKPVIVPERMPDGWRTNNLELKAGEGTGGFYLFFASQDAKPHKIHLTPSQLEGLIGLLESAPGLLWRKLSDIPLERPLPSRSLEEELRVLLTTFGGELRRPRR